MSATPLIRRLVAGLCIAAVLLAVLAPAASGHATAVLPPPIAGAVTEPLVAALAAGVPPIAAAVSVGYSVSRAPPLA